MLRKYISILSMTVAYAILLGHSIVPHHHHDNHHDLSDHHQTHHDHEGAEEGNDLSHLFSHFIHSADGFTFTSSQGIGNLFSKQMFSFVAILPYSFSFDELPIPPLLYKPPAEHFIYTSPHSLSSGLRAPPAFIG